MDELGALLAQIIKNGNNTTRLKELDKEKNEVIEEVKAKLQALEGYAHLHANGLTDRAARINLGVFSELQTVSREISELVEKEQMVFDPARRDRIYKLAEQRTVLAKARSIAIAEGKLATKR